MRYLDSVAFRTFHQILIVETYTDFITLNETIIEYTLNLNRVFAISFENGGQLGAEFSFGFEFCKIPKHLFTNFNQNVVLFRQIGGCLTLLG